MIDLLADNPLLLLFVVAALGYPLGRIRVGGFQLGVAAVLFVGLAIGALDPRLALPDFVFLFGLVLFVYTIGLASGRHFFRSFQRGGLRDNLLVLVVLLLAAAATGGAALVAGLSAASGAGLFTGSLTNTPALASLLELLQGSPGGLETVPVVAYAVTYPVGVVGPIVAIWLLQRWFRVDYAAEAQRLKGLGATGEALQNATVRITRPDIGEQSIEGWRRQGGWHVLVGRVRRGDEAFLATPYTVLRPGDEVGLIGERHELDRVIAELGEAEPWEHLEFDRSHFDFRRIFVSEPEMAGRPLEALELDRRYGALVTRVRRGDLDMLPEPGMRLELGDRVRVVAPRERLPELAKAFGDSYRALSEVDVVSLGLGVALGMLLGLVPIPLPGGVVFRLGLAGGPLIAALVLGALGRTGPVLWQLPYNANLTLRQLGLILFLAGVGTRSGFAFASTVTSPEGLALVVAGAIVTLLASLLTLTVGYLLLRIPMSLLIGMLAGQQTQPAVLGFAAEQTGNDLPSIGYATVFPLATIVKIVLAQLLLVLLSGGTLG